jgi:hypothetical protein
MQVRYSKDHEYIIVEDGIGTVGIMVKKSLVTSLLSSSRASASK